MSLVLIHAQAPWGPVSFKTAGSMADLLTRGERPAEIIDVGERNPADVVREALRMMPPPFDATGQIPVTVEKARNSVVEAVSCVLARVVADDPDKANSGKPESHDSPMALGGEAEPRFARKDAVDSNPGATNSNPIRRRLGAEMDARAIRRGLGLSQPAFAKAFGIPLATLRDWEQGRSRPEGAGRTLLAVIEAQPDAVRHAVKGAGSQ